MVSIIIPTRDRRQMVLESIASVQAQTYLDWQCIVVDDHSTDGTNDALHCLAEQDPRVSCISLPASATGANAARNAGLRCARGEWILFLDSDDAVAPFCLQQRLRAMEARPELDFGVFPTLLFRKTPGDGDLLWNVGTDEDDLDRFIFLDIPWQTAGVLWRQKALATLGPWHEALPSWQDWEFHIRALRRGLRYRRFDRPDCYWREPRADSLWKCLEDPSHLRAHLKLMKDLVCEMKKDGTWSERRKLLFAGLWFWHARFYYGRLRRRGQAVSIWAQAWTLRLVTTRHWLTGMRWFSRCLRGPHDSLELVFPGWPLEYRTGTSPTFQQMKHNLASHPA